MSRRLFSTSDFLYRASAAVTAAPVTLAGWIRPYNTTASAGFVLSLHNNGSAGNINIFRLSYNSLGSMSAITGSATNSSSATSGTVPVGSWSHVGGVFASATSRFAYLNGVAGTESTTSRVPSGINSTAVGIHYGSTIDFPFDGDLAHLAIWNVALTASEMQALSGGMQPYEIRPLNLVEYWPLNNGGDFEYDYWRYFDRRLAVAGTGEGTLGVGEEPPLMRRWQRRRPVLFGVTAGAATVFIPIVGRGPGMSLAENGGGLAGVA